MATRSYGGYLASKLAERADDLDALDQGHVRPGAARRLKHCLYRIATRFMCALSGYRTVRDAISRLEDAPVWGLERITSRTPRSYTWRQAPLSSRQWERLDTKYGFDVRGTSPRWIARRASALRTQRKEEATSDFYKSTRPARETAEPFIGPPCPRDHAGTDDFFMVWPPVRYEELDAFISRKDGLAPVDVMPAKGNPFTDDIIDALFDVLISDHAPQSIRTYNAHGPP